MALDHQIREKIAIEVIRTLITRFESFPEDASNNRNAPFHEAFLNAFSDKLEGKVSEKSFFLSLSSWLHGLNTTLGQKFFENVAHHLSNGEKREYTSKKIGCLKITRTQKTIINEIITKLSNDDKTPDLQEENNLLLCNDESELTNALDFSADVFIEDRDQIIAIELKSVKPNSGEMRGEKQKILEGKSALYKQFPHKKILFFMGFPFDPTVRPEIELVTSYNKERFLNSIINMTKYFDPQETLIASELWDVLSGQKNTMEELLRIINTIATPDFFNKYQILTDNSKRLTPEYFALLSEWFLVSEQKLISHNDIIERHIEGNRRLVRIFHKTAFDGKGYNWMRYYELCPFLAL